MKLHASRTARFEALLRDHSGTLSRIAAMYARTPEDRGDLIQEIRLQLWNSLDRLDPRRPEKTWVYKVSLNTAISWFRKASRWQPLDIDCDAIPAPEDHRTEAILLTTLISQLSPLHRALLALHLEELSNAEVGDILGISPENVATKLTRIRQQLRDLANKPQPL